MKRVLLLLSISCSGSGSAPVASTAEAPKATIAQGEVADRVLLTGELRAGVAIEITVPMTETWELTIRYMAEDGTSVKAGDKVLEFDNSAFTNGLVQKKIAVTEATSALRAYRDVSAVSLSVKQHEVEQARVAAEKAKLLASVPADLLPQRTVQDRQLDKTRTELALSKAEKDLQTEKQAVALEGKVKQIEVDKAIRAVETAEKAINELTIKAPRDGAISVGTHPWEGRRFQVGDSVQPGFVIVTLPDFSQPMEVKAELSDVDDGRVKLGQKGTCTLDAYPTEPLPCEVKEVAPVARNKQRQSLRRMFAIGLSIPNKDPDRMRPGMSVKIELPGEKQKGLVAPRSAIVSLGPAEARSAAQPRGDAINVENKQAAVRLASGELKPVTLGGCDAQRCVIATGVSGGEEVR